jgi:hypothetical protein
VRRKGEACNLNPRNFLIYFGIEPEYPFGAHVRLVDGSTPSGPTK